MDDYIISVSGSSLCCAWCGQPLGNASNVTILNGNQPICDLCIIRATSVRSEPHETQTGNSLYSAERCEEE